MTCCGGRARNVQKLIRVGFLAVSVFQVIGNKVYVLEEAEEAGAKVHRHKQILEGNSGVASLHPGVSAPTEIYLLAHTKQCEHMLI